MKKHKKAIIITAAVLVLLCILFVPYSCKTANDGGTREYTALTYKLVRWHRIIGYDYYDATRIYWLGDRAQSLDDLWKEEYQSQNQDQDQPDVKGDHVMRATVMEIHKNSVLVEPHEGQPERASSDRISFGTASLPEIGIQIGSVVDVTYSGEIMETYPAQITAEKWELVRDFRGTSLTGEWVNRDGAVHDEYERTEHLIITEIYDNCFIAKYVIPMPYTVLCRYSLSSEWCVGDQIAVNFTETWYNDRNMEAEVSSVAPSDFQPEPDVCYKPVIYLYPEEQTDVTVSLGEQVELTCTYPAYRDGWRVTAMPDGTLYGENGMTYSYLYWEGIIRAQYDFSQGFCIAGKDTASFLEQALEALGLTRKEANEFIVYWLPLMQDNPYNVITFTPASYNEAAPLRVSPAPDTLIRVYMAWYATDEPVAIAPQTLTAPVRRGFTVVEWGGTQIEK